MNDKEKLETIKGLVDGLDDPDFQGYTPKKSAVFSVALDSFNTIISDFENDKEKLEAIKAVVDGLKTANKKPLFFVTLDVIKQILEDKS